jgi:hypothetical protein
MNSAAYCGYVSIAELLVLFVHNPHSHDCMWSVLFEMVERSDLRDRLSERRDVDPCIGAVGVGWKVLHGEVNQDIVDELPESPEFVLVQLEESLIRDYLVFALAVTIDSRYVALTLLRSSP